MKLKITLLFITLSTIISNNVLGQDFIRVSAAHDFQKNKVVQTFSFDFNRTEKIDEKKGKSLLFGHNNFYILPTSDVNIGDGVTSSENNILFQVNMGKAFYGENRKSKDNLRTSFWNKAIEFNPSYNSDKLFQEKLAFGQLKFLINLVSQKHKDATENTYIQSVHSIAKERFSPGAYTAFKVKWIDGSSKYVTGNTRPPIIYLVNFSSTSTKCLRGGKISVFSITFITFIFI